MIDFVLTVHGSDRRTLRRVSRRDIDDTLNDPLATQPGKTEGTKKYIGRFRDDNTRVVVIASDPPDEENTVRIITCYRQGEA